MLGGMRELEWFFILKLGVEVVTVLLVEIIYQLRI